MTDKPRGMWVTYDKAHTILFMFGAELDALRCARVNHLDEVRFVPLGEDVFEPNPQAKVQPAPKSPPVVDPRD